MSNSKFKYFTVTNTSVVKATNKTEALQVAANKRGASGELMSREIEVDQIKATEARTLSAS